MHRKTINLKHFNESPENKKYFRDLTVPNWKLKSKKIK